MTGEYPHKTNMNVWPVCPADPEQQVTFADVCTALGAIGCEEPAILAYELNGDGVELSSTPPTAADNEAM